MRKKPLEEENNEVREEIETNFANNVVPKSEEWGESSRQNSKFLRPRYVAAERTTNFSFGFTPRKN